MTDGKEGLGDLSELLGEKVGGVELHWVGGAGNLGGGELFRAGRGEAAALELWRRVVKQGGQGRGASAYLAITPS